ncbi:MAG: Ig-like domain-containing protein [Puniceicoccaceae bacterium]
MRACLRKLITLLLISGLVANSLLAQLTVDDFEDNVKDPALWSADSGSAFGQLNEINGRLEFTSSDPFGEVERSRPYNLTLPADSGWVVTAEVANFVLTTTNPQIASLGIAVFPTGDSVREVWIELYSSWTSGIESVWGYNAQLIKASDPDNYYGFDSGNVITASEGQLRLTYDSGTRIITADYWPSNEPDWIELASFGVGGSGGLNGNSDWGLGSEGTFEMTLWGYTLARSVSSGNAFFESISVQATGGSGPPLVANNDRVTIRKDVKEYEIEAKVNDRSVAGGLELLTITNVTETTIGAIISTNGDIIVYTPPEDFLGTETLTYTIEDGDGNTDTAEIEINIVDVSYPGSESDSVLISTMELVALQFPEWAPYLALYEKHIAEILTLTLDLENSPQSSSFGLKTHGSPVGARSGSPERQAQLENIFQLLVEPAVSVLTGETDEVVVSEELVTEIIDMRIYLEEAGSDFLKADIQELVETAEDKEAIIGRSIAEQAIVDPGTGIVEAFEPELLPGSIFSISSWNATGLALNLWRYNLEAMTGWEQLPTTDRTPSGEKVILSDPNPISDPALYQVRGERENVEFDASTPPN